MGWGILGASGRVTKGRSSQSPGCGHLPGNQPGHITHPPSLLPPTPPPAQGRAHPLPPSRPELPMAGDLQMSPTSLPGGDPPHLPAPGLSFLSSMAVGITDSGLFAHIPLPLCPAWSLGGATPGGLPAQAPPPSSLASCGPFSSWAHGEGTLILASALGHCFPPAPVKCSPGLTCQASNHLESSEPTWTQVPGPGTHGLRGQSC